MDKVIMSMLMNLKEDQILYNKISYLVTFIFVCYIIHKVKVSSSKARRHLWWDIKGQANKTRIPLYLNVLLLFSSLGVRSQLEHLDIIFYLDFNWFPFGVLVTHIWVNPIKGKEEFSLYKIKQTVHSRRCSCFFTLIFFNCTIIT